MDNSACETKYEAQTEEYENEIVSDSWNMIVKGMTRLE
jgi:hypothetical protein